MFKTAIRTATTHNGMVKFLEPSDISNISKEDYIIYYDENTLSQSKELKGLGIDCNYVDLKKIKEIENGI